MIAIAFDLNFRHAAEIFSGASDYVAEVGLDWRLVPLNFGFEAKLMELAESGKLDGAIGTFVSDGWIAGLVEHGVAAVNLFHFSKIESIPSVSVDDFQIGEQAARHLTSQGARSFAFYGSDSVYYTRLRRAGFQAQVPEHAYLDLQPGAPLAEHIRQLTASPRPLGVLCSTDRLARELINEARNQELQCGKDLLVVGIDNDPSESIFAGLGITSFKLPSREIGYLAAKQLHGILEQTNSPDKTPPASQPQLIPRESSLAPGRARIAQRAANYIQENLSDPELEMESLAHRMGVSRRSLELAFKDQFKTSPYRMLSDLRLKLAGRLLKESAHPVMEVGRRCGYPEPHHFSAWFKKQSGFAPRSFRESAETHPIILPKRRQP